MLPCVGLRTRRGAGDFGFLELALAGIGQQVIRIARAHDAGAGQRQRDARGVDRDPAAAPLLGDVGGGAGAAGRIEHEVAGVGGHQDATLDHLGVRLHDIHLSLAKPTCCVSSQMLIMAMTGKSSRNRTIAESACRCASSRSALRKPLQSRRCRLPSACCLASKRLSLEIEIVERRCSSRPLTSEVVDERNSSDSGSELASIVVRFVISARRPSAICNACSSVRRSIAAVFDVERPRYFTCCRCLCDTKAHSPSMSARSLDRGCRWSS